MFVLFTIFVLSSIVIISLACNDISFIISLCNMGFSGTNWNFFWNFDYVSFGILLMLFICFSYAYFYTGHYFSGSAEGKNLNLLICLFVVVMASLVLTGDYLLTLIFWEYLGVVSFFLILFYLNFLSLRASIVTLVSSRFGDVCLFLLFAFTLFTDYNSWTLLILFSFIILTKSASFPFISWLLEAMRAPTPVSSLVHSSTLVAAGVWFSLRYDFNYYNCNSFFIIIILLTTILITGLCCFFFLDLKKIVALSTCNNIAWCLLYLIFGDVCLCLFQLLSHGVSKCLLFMLVGDVMSGSGGSQSSNCVYSPQLYSSWGLFGLFSVILGLSGAPFIGVFFTKHLLLTWFYSLINIPVIIVTFLCIFLSYFYSFRLCRVLYNINVSVSNGVFYSFNSGVMVYFWLFVNYFIASFITENNNVSSGFSFILIIFQVFSCVTAYLFYSSVLVSSWSSSLWGCDNLVEASFQVYNFILDSLMLFFYRWDKYFLSLFSLNNSFVLNVYKENLLNFIFFTLIVFILMCFYILY